MYTFWGEICKADAVSVKALPQSSSTGMLQEVKQWADLYHLGGNLQG